MSTDRLLAEVRATVLRELDGLDPSCLVLRLDDVGDPSVFVAARLGDETGLVMITRIYEADLHREGALQPVYLSGEDAEILLGVLSTPEAPPRGHAGAAMTDARLRAVSRAAVRATPPRA